MSILNLLLDSFIFSYYECVYYNNIKDERNLVKENHNIK